MNLLDGMTQEKWSALSPTQREAIMDYSALSPQLKGFEGVRVEVVRMDGTTARFIVGRSTGWKPCHIEISRRNTSGGPAASTTYKSVRPLYRVRPAR